MCLDEEIAAVVVAQIFMTVKYMRKKLIVHRDLKLENIMIHEDKEGDISIKIIDFGSAI